MARRVHKNHYVAPSPVNTESPTPVHISRGGMANRGYSTDGEESQREPSERTMSEYTTVPYTVVNERLSVPARKHRSGTKPSSVLSQSRNNDYGDNGSDIYVTSAAYKAPSEISRGSRYSRGAPSHYSYRSGVAPSMASTTKTRTSRKGGVTVETMAAPNPFCPNIKGMCCLMLLLNLGLILVTLGIVIVIQFIEPFFVWVLGIVFLIFGLLTLAGSFIYCVLICRDVKHPKDVRPEDMYWTHHWQKTIGSPPEIHYRAEEKYPDTDRYSDRFSVSKMSTKYSDRGSQRY